MKYMMDDFFKELGIKLTDTQIERQITKMKKAVFGDYQEYDDGSYKGEVNREIFKILEKYISNKERLTEVEYLDITTNCSMALVEWMKLQLKGIDIRLMALYCFDFVNQTMGTLYGMVRANDFDSDNPMYS